MAAISPKVYPLTLQAGQAVIPLQPLDGDTGQTASRRGAWQPMTPGSILQLVLIITALTAATTASFSIETCNQVASGVAVDTPRTIGYFQGAQGLIAPTAPFTSPMGGSGVCDNYIRVVATVGAGATCAWTIAGKAIVDAHATPTTI